MSYVFKTALALRSNYGNARNTNQIKYIVFHYTANDGDHDESNAKYFQTAYRGASAHYFVDDDSVTQSVPDNYVAWSVGGNKYKDCATTGGGKLYGIANNTNTLNIEMCDTVKDGVHNVTAKTKANAIELCVSLMKKYNIDINHVIRHFDVVGKKCPAYLVNTTAWNNFKTEITKAMQPASFTIDGIDMSLVFNPTDYANYNPDIKNALGTDANKLFQHWKAYGVQERRRTKIDFDIKVYMTHPDLQKVFGENALLYFKHYVQYGHKENRKCV